MIKIFTGFVNDLLKKEIEVEFFIAPIIPLVYEIVEKDYPAVINSEKWIKIFADKKNIKLYGSFDPVILNYKDKYFYDGMHCSEEGGEKTS